MQLWATRVSGGCGSKWFIFGGGAVNGEIINITLIHDMRSICNFELIISLAVKSIFN
jgi:hypothetical protein